MKCPNETSLTPAEALQCAVILARMECTSHGHPEYAPNTPETLFVAALGGPAHNECVHAEMLEHIHQHRQELTRDQLDWLGVTNTVTLEEALHALATNAHPPIPDGPQKKI